jgi:hypothetical protein
MAFPQTGGAIVKDTVNHFRRIYELGYHRLVPIVPPGAPLSENSTLFRRIQKIGPAGDARGKAPGLRGSNGWYGLDLTKDHEVEFERWQDMGAGVGIKTGQGLVAIDADTMNKDLARIIKQAVEKFVGRCPPLRIGQFPKALYLVRTDPDFIYTRIEFGERDAKGRLADRVEILADGRQFVAHGIHPKTNELYDWRIDMPPIGELPFVSGETLHAMLEDLRPMLPAASALVIEGAGAGVDVDQESLRGDPKLVEKEVHSIANTSAKFPTRESYLAIGYAIKAALPDDPDFAFELFADWCLAWQDGENDTEIITSDWDRMKPPFRRGAQYLYRLADEEGDAPGSFTAEIYFDHAVAAAANEAPLFPEELPNPFEQSGEKQVKRFPLTSFADAAATALSTAAQPLIKGVLDQGAMTILYGESNAGKTFVAMDMAYHIAAGVDWAGKRTAKLPVLYVAAEGGQGARKRAAALASKHGTCEGFYFLMHPINLLRADADLKPLIDTARDAAAEIGQGFGLVVIDTLSRAMAGGDENSSTDMGAMVKHLDVLRKALEAHVMAVHHSGKDRARGARGHSLLRAAPDTEIEVADRVISVTKQRDLDGSFSSGFDLDVVTLGVDAEGDPVTSCTVKLISRHEAQAVQVGVLTPSEATVAAAVTELDAFNEGENEGVGVSELIEFLAGKLADLSPNSIRQHLKRGVQKGALTKCRRGRWKTANYQSGQASGQDVFS